MKGEKALIDFLSDLKTKAEVAKDKTLPRKLNDETR